MASRARRETTLPRGGVYATIVGSVSARQPVIPARPSSMGAALRKGGRHLTQLSSWAKLKGGVPVRVVAGAQNGPRSAATGRILRLNPLTPRTVASACPLRAHVIFSSDQ